MSSRPVIGRTNIQPSSRPAVQYISRMPKSRWFWPILGTLALVAGGAMGNLIDRLRSPRGVVDFIDVGIGDARFWTFNVADAEETA